MRFVLKFASWGFVLGVAVALIIASFAGSGVLPESLTLVLCPTLLVKFGTPITEAGAIFYVFYSGLILAGNGVIYAVATGLLGALIQLFRKEKRVSFS